METIHNVKLIEGLNKSEIYKRIKLAFNYNVTQTSQLIENLLYKHETEIDSSNLHKLRQVFTFDVIPESEKQSRIYQSEIKLKREKAQEWYNKLTVEEKEYLQLLGPTA